MKINIICCSLALLLGLFFIKASAQCSVAVTNYTSGGNVASVGNGNISFVQTFKPVCSGTINTLVFPVINFSADDFRGTGYFVECRIKDGSGNILGIAPRTDQWYPGASVTFQFSCKNISLVAGSTYQFELLGIEPAGTSTYPVYLLRRSNTSVYADGNCIIDGTPFPNSDLYGWTINLANGNIGASTSSVTQAITPCQGFYNAANELITSISSGSTNGVSGTTTAKVWVETIQPAEYVKRHYEITPAMNASTATGTITLYFTQAEFDAFNAVNSVKLPTSSLDNTGIANLKIEKRPGTSSNGTGLPSTYTGTPITIDPIDADIIWNTVANRWEVRFATIGFSGFFIKTSTYILPLRWLSVSGTLTAQQHASLQWRVDEKEVLHYEIEKSSDGRNYSVIGKLSGKGNGTNTYHFTENTPVYATTFYRIKQTDRNGKFNYASIVKLSAALVTSAISVYPNPVKDKAVITVPESMKNHFVQLIDSHGKIVQTHKVVSSVYTIDMQKYPSGIYLLQFDNGTSNKIIKN